MKYQKKMKVLVACEYSGRVRDAFIANGHEAISCDFLDTEVPGPHIKGDVTDLLREPWDLIIAHPSCTYLTIAAEWAYKDDPGKKMAPTSLYGQARREAREEALLFIDKIWQANSPLICIENPVGVIPARRPEMPRPQYIQPHQFGEDASKKTGLWLKGLPQLMPTRTIYPRWVCCGHVVLEGLCQFCNGDKKALPRWGNQTDSGQNKLPPSKDRWKIRSETYRGIASAMADQWGGSVSSTEQIPMFSY